MPDKSAASVALFLFMIFCDFGFPRIIISDNGSEFVNQLIAAMVEHCGIDHRLSTKYHPRGHGLVERTVQTATNAITKCLNGEYTDWDRQTPMIQLYINQKFATLHKTAPFAAMFCRMPNQLSDYSNDESNPTAMTYDEITARFAWANDVIFPATRDMTSAQAAKAITHFAKHNRILKDPFPIGSFVMVLDPRRRSKKEPRYEGPFKVLKRTRGGSYHLLDTDNTSYARAVAPVQMKLVSKAPEHDAVSFVVDRILDHKGPANKRQYLVRWKSFGKDQDSWEPHTNFDDIRCLNDYWSKKNSQSK